MTDLMIERIKALGSREMTQALIDVACGISVEVAVMNGEKSMTKVRMFLDAEVRKYTKAGLN